MFTPMVAALTVSLAPIAALPDAGAPARWDPAGLQLQVRIPGDLERTLPAPRASAASNWRLERGALGEEASTMKLTLLNQFLFMLPPLAWNLALGSRLPTSDFPGSAPGWLLVAENVARAAVIAYPLLQPIDTKHDLFAPGAAVYGAGLAVYFASWVWLISSPGSELSHHPAVAFAPMYTPAIWLAGMAMMSRSPVYLAISAVFVALHVGEFAVRYRG